jgi:DNA polymerase elongation subunit (family B)
MIIEYTQKKDSLDVSYVDNNNQITVEELFLHNGYYSYVECDESDPGVLSNLKSFKNSPIKIESAKYFRHHNVNEFFNYDIPKNYPEFHEKFSKLSEPNPFSIDIEVVPTEEFGYSDQEKTENPITSICITDKSLNSILFIIKNKKHPEINDIDKGYINSVLQDALKHHYTSYPYDYQIRIFDSESEMLQVFLECINNYFHLTIGWNFLDYDWQYISNRCSKLGVDVKKASPTHKLTNKTIEINETTKIELKIPSHRIISDYMYLFKDSLIYNNLGSYSLDNIAETILKLHKVKYDGNLRTLYEENYLKFIGYAFIDTILVMLIHKITNLLTVDFFQSFYTGVPYLKLSQNSISEALVYQELRNENLFLLESEKTHNPARKYAGGYVKPPLKKIVESVMGEDFKALYPNSMITMGLSPEAKIDCIQTDLNGYPINEEENQKWLKYKSMGYALSPLGRIYDVTTDSLYTRIEKKLLAQRNIFQGHANDIYLDIIPKLKDEINNRKQKLIT